MNEALLLWGLGLLAAAVLLTVIEVFVPSGGIIGVVAIIVAVAGVVILFRVSLTWGLIGTLFVVVGGPSAFFFGLNLLPSTPTGRAMMGEPSDEQKQATLDKENESRDRLLAMVGLEGVAVTDLFPSGVVEVDGVKMDAISVGGIADAGDAVRVTGVEMGSLKVRPIT